MPEYLSATRPDEVYAVPAKAASVYYKGRLLGVDTTDGRAKAAADVANLVVAGRIDATVDNSDGAHGDKLVPFANGVFLFKNDPAAPLTQAHFMKPCYVKDDITVSASPGNHNVFAGLFRGFHNNSDGVWVDSKVLPSIAHFFGNHPDSNWRLSTDPDTGASIFQLWNQDQETWQTVQLAGLPGIERLIIAAAA
jgi:hypothetical protein